MGLDATLWLWIDGDQEGERASGKAGIQAVQRLKMWVTRSVCPLRTLRERAGLAHARLGGSLGGGGGQTLFTFSAASSI